MTLSVFDTGWVAGLLDGEGCFMVKRNCIGVTCAMSDEDTIERLHAVVGGTMQTPRSKPNRKVIYVWNLSMREEVVALIEALRPHMSARRVERIDEMLAWHNEHPKTQLNTGNPVRAVHGSHRMYRHYRCRCTPCREAMSRYRLQTKVA